MSNNLLLRQIPEFGAQSLVFSPKAIVLHVNKATSKIGTQRSSQKGKLCEIYTYNDMYIHNSPKHKVFQTLS